MSKERKIRDCGEGLELFPQDLLAETVMGLRNFELDTATLATQEGQEFVRFEDSVENASLFSRLLGVYEVYSARVGVPQLETWQALISHAGIVEYYTHKNTLLGEMARVNKKRAELLLRPYLVKGMDQFKYNHSQKLEDGMFSLDLIVRVPERLILGDEDVYRLVETCGQITQSALVLGLSGADLYHQLAVKLRIICNESMIVQRSSQIHKLLAQYEQLSKPPKE